MKKINFNQLKFKLPAIMFFPLLFLGYMVVDCILTPVPPVRELSSAYSIDSDLHSKYYDDSVYYKQAWAVIDHNDSIIHQNSKICNIIQEYNRHLISLGKDSSVVLSNLIVISDSLSIKFPVRPEKDKKKEKGKDLLDNMKTWASNAAGFFGDIFTKGAIKVYTENEIPKDSIIKN